LLSTLLPGAQAIRSTIDAVAWDGIINDGAR
jgi:hypothetical protein